MRTDGYRQAMEDNGISPQKAYEFSSPSEDSGTLFRLSEEMIKNSGVPDAIFCVNWFRTIGVYGAAKKLGIRLLNGIPLRTKPPPRNSNAPGRKPFRARILYGFRALNYARENPAGPSRRQFATAYRRRADSRSAPRCTASSSSSRCSPLNLICGATILMAAMIVPWALRMGLPTLYTPCSISAMLKA